LWDLAPRDLAERDLPEVVRIDAVHTGRRKTSWWRPRIGAFVRGGAAPVRIALAVDGGDRLAGYLLGEVRAFEFGSEACGWVLALGVDPAFARAGVATALLAAAADRFRAAGVKKVRTMVRRDDVRLLSLFRASGWWGGPFLQLEKDLEAS
jgi:ribosomal protein S18 acetylase RimI-like enzyme